METKQNLITIPEPTFTVPAKISKSDEFYKITDGFPAGGVFSGVEVTPAGIFYVKDLTAGTYTLYYTVTNGFGCSGSVSKNTSYVVVGSDPGSKFADAQKLGISVLSEAEFKKLL